MIGLCPVPLPALLSALRARPHEAHVNFVVGLLAFAGLGLIYLVGVKGVFSSARLPTPQDTIFQNARMKRAKNDTAKMEGGTENKPRAPKFGRR